MPEIINAPSTAPSAVATPNPPSVPATADDFAALASLSLARNAEPPPPAPAPAAAPESPAAIESPATAPAATVATTETPVEPAAPSAPVAPDEDAEPSAEVLASLSDAGKRALQTERERRKEARAESRVLRERLEALEKQFATKTPEPIAPATPPSEPAPTPSVQGAPLADCNTFEAVDARAMQAIKQEALAMRLNSVLVTEGLPAVVEQFKANGIEKLGAKTIDEVTAPEMARFLADKFESAREIQVSAEPRKQYLLAQAQSWQSAGKLVPEITDPKHPRAQKFAAIVNGNPWLRAQGPNWPMIAAKYLLGDESATKTITTAQPPSTAAGNGVPALPVSPPPAPKSAPGAPRNSAAAIPKPNEADELAAKLANGTATPDEMNRYASLAVSRHVSVHG